ncbi:MAG: hypothetical protein JNJ78_09005 [Anaerolineae bacterium]|nr:hypothetical protein [Anaerolineae bacterium]
MPFCKGDLTEMAALAAVALASCCQACMRYERKGTESAMTRLHQKGFAAAAAAARR